MHAFLGLWAETPPRFLLKVRAVRLVCVKEWRFSVKFRAVTVLMFITQTFVGWLVYRVYLKCVDNLQHVTKFHTNLSPEMSGFLNVIGRI